MRRVSGGVSLGAAAAVAATVLSFGVTNVAPQPVNPLEAAVAELGGRARLEALDDWIVEGTGRENLSAEFQGVAPDEPTWRPHQEKVGVRVARGEVAWQRRTPRNDLSVRWRRFIYTPQGSGVVDWISGRGSLNTSPAAVDRREGLMRRIPHVLLRLAAGTSGSRAAGERRLGGDPVDTLDVPLTPDTTARLSFARTPVVLRRVEYPVHVPGRGDVLVAWQFDRWQRDGSLGWKPEGHRIEIDGVRFQEVRYDRYEAGAAEAAAMMTVPADLQPSQAQSAEAPAPADVPADGEVAPGIHVIDVGGFNVMVVEFADFVVAVDAPETHPGLEAIPAAGRAEAGQVGREMLSLISRRFGTRPLRYVIITHHHGDHFGGVRALASTGTTFLVAPGHRATVRAAFERPHTIRPDAWRGKASDVRIESVRDRRVLTDGTRMLEVLNVGRNPHTTENLLAWLPRERLAFQGDLFYYDARGPFPPSGRQIMNRFFADWLVRRTLTPRAVFGVHNRGAAGEQALAVARRAPR